MTQFNSWYRLFYNDKFVGFMKVFDTKAELFSIDNYGWNTTPILFDKRFRWAGVYDRNNLPLFENDIVAIRTTLKPHPKRNYKLIYDNSIDQFNFIDCETQEHLALFAGNLQLIQKQEMTFIGTAI